MQHFAHANSDTSHSAGRARRSRMKVLHQAFFPAGFMKLHRVFVRALRTVPLAALLIGFSVPAFSQPAAESSALSLQQAVKIALETVSYTHLRAHETRHDLVCRLLLEK